MINSTKKNQTNENTWNMPYNSEENFNLYKPAYLSTEPPPAQPRCCGSGAGGGSVGGGRHTTWNVPSTGGYSVQYDGPKICGSQRVTWWHGHMQHCPWTGGWFTSKEGLPIWPFASKFELKSGALRKTKPCSYADSISKLSLWSTSRSCLFIRGSSSELLRFSTLAPWAISSTIYSTGPNTFWSGHSMFSLLINSARTFLSLGTTSHLVRCAMFFRLFRPKTLRRVLIGFTFVAMFGMCRSERIGDSRHTEYWFTWCSSILCVLNGTVTMNPSLKTTTQELVSFASCLLCNKIYQRVFHSQRTVTVLVMYFCSTFGGVHARLTSAKFQYTCR